MVHTSLQQWDCHVSTELGILVSVHWFAELGERFGQSDRNLGFIGGLIETLASTQRTLLSVECNYYLHTAVKISSIH